MSFCINGESTGSDNKYSDYAQDSITYSSILMAVMFTLMINTIIQFVLMIRNKVQQKQSKLTAITTQSDDKIVTFGTFLSIFFYFICVLCYLIASIALTNTYNDLDEGTTSKTDYVEMKIDAETASIVFWNFGYGVMQFVLSARLYFTFNQTEYAYPGWVYMTLAFIWFAELAAMITFHVEREGFDNYVLTYLLVIGLVTHILFLSIVMALYTRNLFRVTLSRTEILLQENRSNAAERQRTKDLVDHTTRMSVLTLFAGIFTMCSLVIWLIFFKEEDEAQGGEGVSFEFLNTAWWMLPMDALINALCLFLNLPFLFAFDIYNKLCRCCHGVCGSICMLMVKSLDEKEENQMEKAKEVETLTVTK